MASALNTTNSYVNLELSSSQNDNISEGQLKMKHDDPLLCYLVHKMDIINQELLVKVASEFYTDLEVETAKELTEFPFARPCCLELYLLESEILKEKGLKNVLKI